MIELLWYWVEVLKTAFSEIFVGMGWTWAGLFIIGWAFAQKLRKHCTESNYRWRSLQSLLEGGKDAIVPVSLVVVFYLLKAPYVLDSRLKEELRGQTSKANSLSAENDELRNRKPAPPRRILPKREKVMTLAASVEKFIRRDMRDQRKWKEEFDSEFLIPINVVLDEVMREGISVENEKSYCQGADNLQQMEECVAKLRALARTVEH